MYAKFEMLGRNDLAALERNLNKIRSALPEGIQYISVVKADAYGHGIHPTAARLMQTGLIYLQR